MAGTKLGAVKGWETRRANAQAVERARATSDVPGVPPGAGRVQSTRDGAIVWAAPRSPEGRIEPQAALGVGSVSDDIIGRHGAFVARGGSQSGLVHVQGLRTVTLTYYRGHREDLAAVEDGEVSVTEAFERLTRRMTVDFGQYKTPRDRELAIARALQDHARSLIKEDSSYVILVSLVRVGAPIQLQPSRRPKRKGGKPAKEARRAPVKSKGKRTPKRDREPKVTLKSIPVPKVRKRK